MIRNRQAMPPCLSMLSQRLWKFCLKRLTQPWVKVGMVMFWAWLCCKITRQPFCSFATGFYYAAWRWEHGTTASSAGLLVNAANESTRHHFICSSSCTKPQEFCCKRSEQQQTWNHNFWSLSIIMDLNRLWIVWIEKDMADIIAFACYITPHD